MIIAGDIGGTKVRLSVFERREGRLVRGVTEQVSSRSVAVFDELLKDFAHRNAPFPKAVCIGVPGPVVGGEVTTVNLPWHLSATALERSLQAPVLLVNDLVATVASIPHLTPADIVVIHEGAPRLPVPAAREVYAMLAPGTGTGQAFLVVENGRPVPLASEGGHVDFSPNDEEQDSLLRYLRKRFGHVSVERVLCGPGLYNIFQFLRDEGAEKPSSALLERLASATDPGAIVGLAAERREDPVAVRALDLFVSILGAQAGNLMLSLMATGGVYLGGGIPPKIVDKLMDGRILDSYTAKGRLSEVVRATPLSVVRDDHAALTGAAWLAEHLEMERSARIA